MNNQQFRRLVLDTPSTASKDGVAVTPGKDGSIPPTLGSRVRSSIPMTPRSVAGSVGIDFARQLREEHGPSSNTKKFRSSAAPKGSKLAAGYRDRTRLRTSVEEDEKAARVKALEEMVKLGQMEQATFEALRDEIIGGDVKDVHLVKGLDWKLLERVRKGEDVLSEAIPTVEKGLQEEEVNSVDIDEALEDLEAKELKPLVKEERVKKGEMAPPPASLAGRKRTRDDILRELKESRLKAAEEKKTQQPSLGPKFKKLGAQQQKPKIERDERGREVLVTTDADGKVKRKVKKATNVLQAANGSSGLLIPDGSAKPLGMIVPTVPVLEVPREEDFDIFEGVGNDYDPLGGMNSEDDDDDSDNSDDIDASKESTKPTKSLEPHPDDVSAESILLSTRPPSEMPLPPLPKNLPTRNYFNDTSISPPEDTVLPSNPLTDPAILAALKKASTIKPLSTSSPATNEEEAVKLARRKAMLEGRDRDADDMDLGFGSSRFEDQEEGEDRQIKLSEWGTKGGEEDGKGDGKKRKRGAKKRKGDKNSAADVLKVMERRKEEGR